MSQNKGFKKILNESLEVEDKKKIDYNSQQLSMQFPPEATARIDAMARFYRCEPGEIVAQGLVFMEQRFVLDAEAKAEADKANK